MNQPKPSHPHSLAEKIKPILKAHPEIKLAYLYGSHAHGKPTPLSDLDIALLTDDRAIIPHITAEIAKTLNIPEDKISILDLDRASPTLTLRAMARGVKLLDRGGYEQKLRSQVGHEPIEVAENEKTSFTSWLKANPVDEATIKRIYAQLQEDLEDLRELKQKGLDQALADKNTRKAFERTLHTAIEGMLDLLRHVTTALNLGTPEYYRDYVEIARRKGVITEQTAKTILELIPTRHTLTRRYRELDYRKLWSDADKAIQAIPSLMQEVKDYLKRTIKKTS